MVPAKWMWDRRNKLSADHKQVKLEIDKQLWLKTPKATAAFLDLTPFREQFDFLKPPIEVKPAAAEPRPTPAKHSNLQGMLLEIGRLRGFQTFSPNRSPRFGSQTLGEIATVRNLPEFPGLNNNIVRQIDVVWLEKSFPVHAFEVELSTGMWSGLVRLGELRRLSTVLHVITDADEGAFKRRVAGDVFTEILKRCHHAAAKDVRELYDNELRIADLRNRLSV